MFSCFVALHFIIGCKGIETVNSKTHDSEIDHDLWEKDIELENVCRENSILFEK